MIAINGTLKQHIYLNNWAWAHNEKILEFIPKISHEVFETTVYPIIEMPVKTSDWLKLHCDLDFVKNFYNDRE